MTNLICVNCKKRLKLNMTRKQIEILKRKDMKTYGSILLFLDRTVNCCENSDIYFENGLLYDVIKASRIAHEKNTEIIYFTYKELTRRYILDAL